MDEQQAKRALEYQTALSQYQTLVTANSELKAKNDRLGSRMASLDKELMKKQHIVALEWELRQAPLYTQNHEV